MSLSFQNKWLFPLAAAFILMITMGIRMSLGLFVPPLANDTVLSITQISLAMAITQLMWGVSQPLTGALADRYGAWTILWSGTLLLVLGCLLITWQPNMFGLTLGMGVMMALGAGAGSFSILMSQVANRVPTHWRGVASGMVNAGGSFGQFVFAPLIQFFIGLPQSGWRGAMWMLAAMSLLVLPVSRWITRQESSTFQAASQSSETSLKQSVKDAFCNKSYLLLHAGFFTCGFHIAFLVTHLPTEVALCGLPANVASNSLAIIGLANVAGSLIVGWCVGHFRSKYLLFWMYGSRALLIVGYLLAPRTDLNFYLFAAGLGMTWLATVAPTAAITGKLFGTRYLATLFGFTLLSHQIGGFFGAYLGGWAIVRFGDYGWMWYADIALAILAALCNLPIKEPKIQRSTD